jgi:hypothetical protein
MKISTFEHIMKNNKAVSDYNSCSADMILLDDSERYAWCDDKGIWVDISRKDIGNWGILINQGRIVKNVLNANLRPIPDPKNIWGCSQACLDHIEKLEATIGELKDRNDENRVQLREVIGRLSNLFDET